MNAPEHPIEPFHQALVAAPRVCFITEGFPPTVGGIEKHTFALANWFNSKGVEVSIFTRQSSPASAELEHIGNISVRRIPPGRLLKGQGWKAVGPMFLFLARILYQLIRHARRYDIIIVFGSKALPIAAVVASVVGRKKLVIEVEDPLELREGIAADSLRRMKLSRFPILQRLVRRMRSTLLRRADCLVAISSEIRRELIAMGVHPRRIRSIPIGVDTEKFRPVSADDKRRIRQRLSLPADRFILTFTGRLAASKGVPLLIQVWKRLVEAYEDIHLVVVGSSGTFHDSCEAELRDYIEAHHLEESVSLPGQVDNVHEFLQAADVFVFPSESEGFGLSIVEALACQLPTVTTRVGVANDYIENRVNGVLINPKDPQDLQTALEWVLDHKEHWADLGLNGRRGVVERYGVEAVSEKYLEMVVELAHPYIEA